MLNAHEKEIHLIFFSNNGSIPFSKRNINKWRHITNMAAFSAHQFCKACSSNPNDTILV